MSLERLWKDGKIDRVEKEKFDSSSAEKDLLAAKRNFESGDYEWAMSIAYNAVLRAARSLMAQMGYRAVGKEHHKATFEFLREAGLDKSLVDYFDAIRKKRNAFIYGDIETTSKENAMETLSKANFFVQKIRTFVQKIRT